MPRRPAPLGGTRGGSFPRAGPAMLRRPTILGYQMPPHISYNYGPRTHYHLVLQGFGAPGPNNSPVNTSNKKSNIRGFRGPCPLIILQLHLQEMGVWGFHPQ